MKIKIVLLLLLIPVLLGFYKISELNYAKYRYIQAHIIQHPEKLPTPEAAKMSSFGFRNMMADMFWLETVQYIGGNVIGGEYKKYLYAMMELITELDPYFESPYVIGQLLLPSNESDNENLTETEIQNNISQGERLGLKGVKNFCDAKKVALIEAQDDLQKITSDPAYQNPCQSYKIPYYLGYIYYFYKNDGKEASKYYKIVAAQSDAPSGAKVLAAIMQGKGGSREKSLFMFLSLAKSLGSPEESCTFMTEKIEQTYLYISKENLPLNGELIRAIESDANIILPKLSEKNEDDILGDTKCSNFLAKAIREINLLYLEQADARYVLDHPGEDSAITPEKLFSEKYINFIPTDYQQYEDQEYGIIYKYNPDIKRFDYEMGF